MKARHVGNKSRLYNMSLYFYVTGEDASCAIELTPPRVVVKYGDPVSVKCTTSAEEFDGLGWEASEGGTGLKEERYVMLTVQSVAEWDNNPMCFITSGTNQCSTRLGLVIYKNISISSSIESSEEMRENEEYILTCSILNIAPVQNLTVRWYQGNQIIYSENLTNSTKKPTNQTSIFRFTPTRQDDRTTIRCEAHMDLGPEGPQFNASSRELSIGVKYSEVEVGEVLGLKCSSVGNPRPNYSWIYYRTHNVNERTEDGISRLIINNANGFNIGSYTCHAWNEKGNVSKTVRVTVKGRSNTMKGTDACNTQNISKQSNNDLLVTMFYIAICRT
uniref:Ig-like domain-containing protein n=1 Tax=Poecilia mexicana TaxID=48701 RepID=A0A3B3YJG9_9TELE